MTNDQYRHLLYIDRHHMKDEVTGEMLNMKI